MNTVINRQWRMASRPVGMVSESNFEWREEPAPEPAVGEVLVRNLYLSLDPTMRGWMNETPGYLPPVRIGDVMRGSAIGAVEMSRDPTIPEGSIVQGAFGWQDYAVSSGRGLQVLANSPDVPLTAYFGLLGHIGLTAYYGLLDVGRPRAGETLVISAAAGAVGSLVGQIGKIVGCKVVGIAGTDEKCRWLTEQLGFDGAINYKNGPVYRSLRAACADGIDVHFENVGGEILDAALALINLRARIVLCGLIAQYNATERVPGPSNLGALIVKRARMEGFLVLDYNDRAEEAERQLWQWHQEGRLQYRVDEVEGLQNAPAALNRLFDGSNTGKLVVRL